MADLSGVNIEKGRLGINQFGSEDAVSGIVISCAPVVGLAFGVPKTVVNISEVIALGITPEYDQTKNQNLYRHLSEFYRLAGEGTELHLMLVAQERAMPVILETEAKQLLAYAGGNIRNLAVAINPIGDITLLNGIPSEVFQSIAKAQILYEWADRLYMPCQIFLEAYHFSGDATSAANLRNLEDIQADKVSLMIGQDYQYAETKQLLSKKYADIGTVLGLAAKARVNQNLGNNEEFNITDALRNIWVTPGISSHEKNSVVLEKLQTLEDKGYLFGLQYTGMAGIRLNNDHVCSPIVIDTDNKVNEHTIALGRVSDKARRELRSAYLPKVKSDWILDEKTGKLSQASKVSLEVIGDNVFTEMKRRGEITYGKTYVDTESDLVAEKKLRISYVLVPRGTVGEIKGIINLKTQI